MAAIRDRKFGSVQYGSMVQTGQKLDITCAEMSFGDISTSYSRYQLIEFGFNSKELGIHKVEVWLPKLSIGNRLFPNSDKSRDGRK